MPYQSFRHDLLAIKGGFRGIDGDIHATDNTSLRSTVVPAPGDYPVALRRVNMIAVRANEDAEEINR
jgi:hypothetical protein